MKSLTLLVKPASSLCNMRCRYCFYEDESENRMQKSMGFMTEQTMEKLIRKAMEYIGENGSLSVVFQGGEPTLAGAAFFEQFSALSERLLPRGARIHYSIQTNGYALSDELVAVWKRYHYLVGLSIDGYRALHNSERVDAAGRETWSCVLGNLKRLQSAGIETNALCVITAQAAENPQRIYRTLKQLGLRYQQYILCLDPLGLPRGTMPYSITPVQYGHFLMSVFDLWYEDWRRGDYVSVRIFEDYVFNAMGAACTNCASSGRCGQYLLIEGDGSVYPCDFYALDDWKLGSIQQDDIASLLSGEAMQRFTAQRAEEPADCKTCAYRFLCRTGCFRDWEKQGSGYRNYYCQSFKMLFDHALPRLMQIAEAEGRSRRP